MVNGRRFPCLVLKGLPGSPENNCGKGVLGSMGWNPGHAGLERPALEWGEVFPTWLPRAWLAMWIPSLKVGMHLTWPHKTRAETALLSPAVEGGGAVQQSDSIMACSWEASSGIGGIAPLAWHPNALPDLDRPTVVQEIISYLVWLQRDCSILWRPAIKEGAQFSIWQNLEMHSEEDR